MLMVRIMMLIKKIDFENKIDVRIYIGNGIFEDLRVLRVEGRGKLIK